jgi:hypothetical protein
MKHSTFAPRSGPARALARTGLVGIMAGLVLAGGTAAGASASTVRVAHVSAGQAGQPDSQTPPAAPTGLVATAGTGQVSLSWKAPASGATSYNIYVAGTPAFRGGMPAYTGVTGTSYVVPNLHASTTYYFMVAAVNAHGTGPASSVASATTKPPVTTPGAPPWLRATAGKGQVTLSWAAPASNGGSPITGYRIYVGTTKTLHGALAVDTKDAGTRVVVPGLSAGRTYYFAVAAVNAHGAGPLSLVAPATPPVITTPPTGPGSTGQGSTGQGSATGPVQVAQDGAQPSPAPTLDLPQDPSSSGTPTGLIILLAGVAAAALAGVAGMAIHLRRLRIRRSMPEPFRPGEPEEWDNRPLSGRRYR